MTLQLISRFPHVITQIWLHIRSRTLQGYVWKIFTSKKPELSWQHPPFGTQKNSPFWCKIKARINNNLDNSLIPGNRIQAYNQKFALDPIWNTAKELKICDAYSFQPILLVCSMKLKSLGTKDRICSKSVTKWRTHKQKGGRIVIFDYLKLFKVNTWEVGTHHPEKWGGNQKPQDW